MNKLRFNFFIAFFITGLFALYSCQDDVTEVIDTSGDDVITTDSPIFDLLGRTTEKDGSFDNILDGSSCTSLELPVTVIVSGIEIIIDSREDLSTIEEIFDEFDNDIDDLDFIFPITVILSNHSKVVIDNKEELIDIIKDCTEGGGDDDIECLDIKYPITIFLYDTATNVPKTIVLENDGELHHLLERLDHADLMRLQYPITLILYDSTEVVVENNHELEDLIMRVKDECDEDDDNDHNDDDADIRPFVEILLEGKWTIDEFFSKVDKTELYKGYIFNFMENGKVWAYNENHEIQGKWEADGDDGHVELELSFPDESIFIKISRDWRVKQYDKNYIKTISEMHSSSNVEDSVAYLSFKRYEGGDPGEPTDTVFVGPVLVEGAWEVARYEKTGNVETEAFHGWILDFDLNGGILAKKGDDVVDGSWDEYRTNEMILKLEFGDGGLFGNLSEEWVVIKVEERRIELKVWKSDNQYEILVLERVNVDPGEPADTVIVGPVITKGAWVVARYELTGNTETEAFNDFVIEFSEDGSILAQKGNDFVDGTWEEYTTNDGQILYLEFGDAGLFGNLSERWLVIKIEEHRIELKVWKGDNQYEILVLERIN